LMSAARFCANVRAARQPINAIETKTGKVQRLAKPENTAFFMEVLLYVVNCSVLNNGPARDRAPDANTLEKTLTVSDCCQCHEMDKEGRWRAFSQCVRETRDLMLLAEDSKDGRRALPHLDMNLNSLKIRVGGFGFSFPGGGSEKLVYLP